MALPIEVIINAGSGGFPGEGTAESVRDLFLAHGVRANVHLAKNGREVESLAKTAVETDVQIVVGGGGDGTISSIAAEVYRANKTLGILPLGTLNHFSKDLGIPQDLVSAIRVVVENHTRNIDLGEVNGRTFINNSSIGLYPRIVKQREYQERLGRGKWWAAFTAAIKMLRRSPFFEVKLVLEDNEFIRKTPFVFVGNNEYEMDFYNIGRRSRLDAGRLSIYFLHRSGRSGVLLLLLRTIFGRLRQARDFEAVNAEEVTIDTRRKRILVAFDGEVALLKTPLHYRTRHGELRVIVPKPET